MQLTVRDAARLLGVSETTLHRWLRSGELGSTRVNDQFRFSRFDLLEFAAARGLPISPELLAGLSAESRVLPSLCEAVRAGGVHRGLEGSDRGSILRALVERLRLPRAADRETLHRVLLAREALGSTALGNGVAIPHPRNPIVLRMTAPAVAVSYLERPADFGAKDGRPVHTIVAILSPSTRVHLHLLALVAAALRDPAVLRLLEARAGEEELLRELARVEAALSAPRAGEPAP